MRVLFLLLTTAIVLRGEEENLGNDEDDDKVFQPTSEWQHFRKDQAIPPGFHVRLNLQTGEREVKLLHPTGQGDDNEGEKSRSTHLAKVDNNDDEERNEDLGYSRRLSAEQLKMALGKIKAEDVLEDVSVHDIERVKKKFRSYSELKKELGDVKLDVETETEVIGRLVAQYIEATSKRSEGAMSDRKELKQEEELLNQLEYLVHQIDNANHFAKLNGFKEVVFKSLNSSSWKVRYEATKLLGSAVQSNPKAQIAALESGAVPVLLRSFALDPSSKVKSGALFAISCLIRRFPAAQFQFLDKGGLAAVIKQFSTDTSGQLQIQMKAVTLVRDLLDELKESEGAFKAGFEGKPAEVTEMTQKLLLLRKLRLVERLAEEGWCQALAQALSRHPTEPSAVEALVDGMLSVVKECHDIFKDSSAILEELTDEYKTLIGQDGYDYLWVHALLIKLNQSLKPSSLSSENEPQQVKDEL